MRLPYPFCIFICDSVLKKSHSFLKKAKKKRRKGEKVRTGGGVGGGGEVTERSGGRNGS